ncbi:hypothetical protein BaRGS_00039236 [Batillaria attramentaria]|uniref:BPTI/Kunitz inhibitor domain-containing protein n=1 Tax=Batillaria attramentaria TaxID=370345 RepID=A0ABD0J3R1_9CAEN
MLAEPGVCPPKRCALHQPPTTCTDTCKDDGDCRGSDKCCQGCDGCRQCIFATGLPTCRVLSQEHALLSGAPSPIPPPAEMRAVMTGIAKGATNAAGPAQAFCMRGTRCVDTPDGPRCGPINGEDRCSLPPDTGPCEAAITRYYFRSSGPEPGCHTFTYGGCKGNGNNFETLSACLNACARVVG